MIAGAIIQPSSPIFAAQILNMKRSVVILAVLMSASTVFAQTGTKPAAKPTTAKTATKPATKPAAKPAAPAMKNILDSASYAIGMSVANFYKQQGVVNLNSAMIIKGCDDIMKGNKAAFDDNTANNIMNTLMNMLQAQKSQVTVTEGEKFLAANKLRPGVKVTASGLQYEIIKDTTGYKPVAADTFVVHYRGTLINGVEFDNSYNRGEPLTYPMSQVVAGWTEGLQLMSIGSHYKFYIPYQLGYGIYGREPTIPGGAVLVFDLTLVDVKRFKDPNSQ
jgi:FKBP-type peptidyl-prolyl cis-trans isomerase